MAVSKKLRWQVLQRDNFTCQYCGASAPNVELQVDHIMPVSKGGKDHVSNLLTSCFDCNQGKKAEELGGKNTTLQADIRFVLDTLDASPVEAMSYVRDARDRVLRRFLMPVGFVWSHSIGEPLGIEHKPSTFEMCVWLWLFGEEHTLRAIEEVGTKLQERGQAVTYRAATREVALRLTELEPWTMGNDPRVTDFLRNIEALTRRTKTPTKTEEAEEEF